jgi:hypothetical protein
VNVNLNLSLSGQADLAVLSPTYTFATPVLGGQLSVGVASWFGKSSGSLAGTLTAVAGPIVATRTGVLADTLVSYGDVVPTASLRWNEGVNNYMVYATGDIPAGDYSSTRLANLGIGHGAVDVGGAYTYLNPATGNEFSATAGFTYNFKNPDTQYRNGVDFHFDWGAAHFVTKQVSSAWPDMPISRSPMTPVKTRGWAASGRAFSVSVRNSVISSRWETCRASWACEDTAISMPPTARRAGARG